VDRTDKRVGWGGHESHVKRTHATLRKMLATPFLAVTQKEKDMRLALKLTLPLCSLALLRDTPL
jgi:hypothetical protein